MLAAAKRLDEMCWGLSDFISGAINRPKFYKRFVLSDPLAHPDDISYTFYLLVKHCQIRNAFILYCSMS